MFYLRKTPASFCAFSLVILAAGLAIQNMSGHDSKELISKVFFGFLELSSKEEKVITVLSA